MTTKEDRDDYDQVWVYAPDREYLIVRVKAPANAHILLSDTMLDAHANVYEVVLGINTNSESVIRNSKYGSNVVWVSTPGILSEDEVRFFWCRWENQILQVSMPLSFSNNTAAILHTSLSIPADTKL